MAFLKTVSRTDKFLFFSSIALIVASIFIASSNDRRALAASDDEEFYRFMDVAAEVYEQISTKYVDEVDSRMILEGALEGMFNALDEHSQYMSPDMLKSLEKDTSGEFSGIGITISVRDGVLTVISPIPGAPSAEAGVMAWDRIMEIEGESTRGMTVQEAVERLTGPAGTKVQFEVYRHSVRDTLEFEVTRANIEIDSVYHMIIEEDMGYVRIVRFSENTSRDVRRAILEMKAEGIQSLIMDLRFNSGGLLREAIDVADLFLDKGEMVVSTKGRLRTQNREYRAESDPLVKLPLFVLVNQSSASASEIVAGAIQDHRLGVVIGPAGKNTFGKGSVQTISNMSNSLTDDDDGNPMDSALRLTTARYYTPSGRTIHHVGVTPDIGVPLTRKQEIELSRHGLLGDVITGEDYHYDEEKENPALIEEEESGIVDQTSEGVESEVDDAINSAEREGRKFYEVSPPELLEVDDFVDVMLEEAIKQMRIYMILQDGREGSEFERIASVAGENDRARN